MNWIQTLLVVFGFSSAFSHAASKNGYDNLPPAKKGGIITMGISGNPKVLNPILSQDANSTSMEGYLFATLLMMDEDSLEFLPYLASKYEVSKDRKTYTFNLNPKAKWQDGAPVTTQDMQFTWDKMMDPKVDAAPMRVYFEGTQLKVIDALKFQFEVQNPKPSTLMSLALVKIIQKKQFENETNFNTAKGIIQPVSNGPYKLAGFSRDQKVEFERIKDWWGNEYTHTKNRFNFDRLVLKIIPDPTLQYEKFMRGELDLMSFTGPGVETYANKIRGTDAARVGKSADEGKAVWANHFDNKSLRPYSFIGWNHKLPLFASAKTRRALSFMVDYQQIVDKVFYGYYYQCTSPFGSKSMFSDPTLAQAGKKIAYDRKKAIELLKEDGWADTDKDNILDKVIDGKKTPFRFTLKYNSNNPARGKIAQIVKENVKAAGIDIQIQSVEWNAYTDEINHRKFDAVIMGWLSSLTMNPKQIWHTDSYKNEGSNYVGYSNPKVDALIDKANAEFDLKKRTKIFQELNRLIYEDQPYTFLVEPGYIMAGFSSKLKSKRWVMDYSQDVEDSIYSAAP